MKKRIAILMASAAALSAHGAAPALAQVDRAGGVETIVVTAQKRAENLQKVPIAVAAVSLATIERLQIQTATDLTPS
jgi:iron complex outermembrane receptor protein